MRAKDYSENHCIILSIIYHLPFADTNSTTWPSTTAVAGKAAGFNLVSATTAVVEIMAKRSNLCLPSYGNTFSGYISLL